MKMKYARLGLLVVTFVVAAVALFLLRRLFSSTSVHQGLVFAPWAIVVSLLAFLLQEMLNPLVAALALRSLGQSTQYWPQLLITLVSISANSTVPVPAGIPLRSFLQKRILHIPYTKSAGGILLETAVGYGTTTLAAVITTSIWLRVVIGDRFSILQQRQTIFVLVAGATLIMALFVLLVARYKKNWIQRTREAIFLVLGARILPLLGMVAVTVFSFGLALIRFGMILYAVDAQAPYGALMAALFLSRLAGVLSFIPMGLGTRDVSLVSLLVLIGVSTPQAVAAAAIDRVIIVAPYLVGGTVATHLLGRNLLNLDEEPETLG